jgi:hypothetical protein
MEYIKTLSPLEAALLKLNPEFFSDESKKAWSKTLTTKEYESLYSTPRRNK